MRSIRSYVSAGSRPVSTLKRRSDGSSSWIMCNSTAPSVWNAVDSAIRGANRSIAHSSTTSGSSPSNSTDSSPASRSSSSSTDSAPAPAKPAPPLFGGSVEPTPLMCLPSGQTSKLVVARPVAERPERLLLAPRRDPTLDEAHDDRVELVGRHTPEHRPPDRRRPVEAAAHEHVVGLQPLALRIPDGRALEAEVADPVLRARMGAAVEMQPQPVGFPPEPVLDQLHDCFFSH